MNEKNAPFKIIDVEQRSEKWFSYRIGKITGSNFSKILTPTLKPSAQQKDVIYQAVGELLTGEVEPTFQSYAMERGALLEDEALDFINFTTEYNFKKVGMLDSGLGFSVSPDGFDLENKIGLEIKSPLSKSHVKYLVDGVLPKEYLLQVHGSMLVSGFDKWMFVSYYPGLKALILEVKRDEKIIKPLFENLIKCSKEIDKRYKQLKEE